MPESPATTEVRGGTAHRSVWRALCGWASPPSVLSDSRELLHDRVRLYAKMLFLINAGFLVLFGGGSELAARGSFVQGGFLTTPG